MSIGKRLIDLARSELNSLLDKAGSRETTIDADDRDPDDDLYQRYGMSAISDEELEAELERRREAPRPGARPNPRTQAPPAARPSSDVEIRKAYASLEVAYGSDFETVRSAYRTLMRKYHPDRHAQTPEKQKAATELAQKLTQAYKLLEKKLRK
jgi:DnaJ-domain-containing protein 1